MPALHDSREGKKAREGSLPSKLSTGASGTGPTFACVRAAARAPIHF